MCFFLCGFGSRPAFGLRLLDKFRVHVEHWTLVFFLCGFGFGPASGLRFLDMIRDHVEPRTFRFFFCGLNWTGYWLYGFCVRQGEFDETAPFKVVPHVRRVISPGILSPKVGEPATNCKRKIFNGVWSRDMSSITYQKSPKIRLGEVDKKTTFLEAYIAQHANEVAFTICCELPLFCLSLKPRAA